MVMIIKILLAIEQRKNLFAYATAKNIPKFKADTSLKIKTQEFTGISLRVGLREFSQQEELLTNLKAFIMLLIAEKY
jgi:hypothetical protein